MWQKEKMQNKEKEKKRMSKGNNDNKTEYIRKKERKKE